MDEIKVVIFFYFFIFAVGRGYKGRVLLIVRYRKNLGWSWNLVKFVVDDDIVKFRSYVFFGYFESFKF